MRLAANNISFNYGIIRALDGVSVGVEAGEAVSIIGPNGAGKSTLLKCINGILRPQSGAVLLDGIDIAKTAPRMLARAIGYVPQSNAEVFPYTVFEIVLMGRKPYIGWSVSRRDLDTVAHTLEFTGTEEFSERYFDELSGGEKQKVVIARAIAQQPRVLLLDEPTSNLDLKHQLEVMELVRQVTKEKGLSVIMAMHDLNLAARFSDRMVVMKGGRLLKTGPPEEVLSADSISEVFGVRAGIMQGPEGKPVITPLSAKRK